MLGKDWNMGSDFVARKFLCYVSRVDMSKVFPNAERKGLPQGAIYVKCHRDSYTDEESQQYGWDMSEETELDLVNYGRLRHLYLQQHPVVVQEQPAAIQQTDEGEARAANSKKTAQVYVYLREVNPDEYGGFTHQCRICGELMKQHGSATDKLIKHFGTGAADDKHPEQWKEIMMKSRHTKRKFDHEGNELDKGKTFRESLPHHVRFTLWLAKSLRPLQISKDEDFRIFLQGLDGGYKPPSDHTVWNIISETVKLTQRALMADMMQVKDEIGSPFFSLQIDLWTTRDMRESYVSLNT
jgi:hypothetical protein